MHLFILSAKNMHSYTLVYNLVNTYGIDSTKLKFIFYDAQSENDLESNLGNFNILFADDLTNPDIYRDIQTVTISSLHSFNAKVIYDLIHLKLITYNQLIIRITDDEVERWHNLYQANGRLTVDNKSLVDKYTLDILAKVSKFICLYDPWGRLLEETLGRRLTIYNINMITNKYLNNNIQDCFKNEISTSILRQLQLQNTVRILVFTKPKPFELFQEGILPDLKNFILNNSESLNSRTLEIAFFAPLGVRVIPKLFSTILVLNMLARYKKVRLKTTLLNDMPREVYFSYLYSTHIIIAQDRGGLGGIYEAAVGGSLIVVKKDSLNSNVLSNLDGLKYIEYDNKVGPISESIQLLSDRRFEDLKKELSEKMEVTLKENLGKSNETFSLIYS